MADGPVLYYFDGRGRAEIIRMALCVAKIKFTEVDFTERDQFLKCFEEGHLLYKAVPLLKIDGMDLVQTNAILNYVVRKAGLVGKDAKDQAWVDVYFEGTRELYTPFMAMLFRGSQEEEAATAEKSFPKYLPVFDKALEKNSSGFLVGSGLTLADIGLMEALLSIKEFCGMDKLEPYPHLKAYFDKVCKMDGMQDYIKNVRKGPNTEEYVANVKKVLGR